MVFFQLAIIIVSFIFLAKSASELITRLAKITHYFGLPEFTTSFIIAGIISALPELSIGINSAIEGTSSFGLGIVFGSNIADLTLIIGIVAFFANSLKLHNSTLKEVKTMLAIAALPLLLLLDGEISRTDGMILIIAFIAYTYMILHKHKNHHNFARTAPKPKILMELAITVFLFAVLFASGHIITEQAKQISEAILMPIFFIGTLIAIGTCLPNCSLQCRQQKENTGNSDLETFWETFLQTALQQSE